MNAVIGALRIVLGADTAQFEKGLNEAQRSMSRAGKSMDKIGATMTKVGAGMSLAITAPLLAAGAGILKIAGDYESAMGRVQISTEASAATMEALSDQARKIGKDTVFSATEAADAMDELAKSGLDAKTILGGAAEATANLAAAAGSGLEPAAHAITDAMSQFGITTKELPALVNQVTGAVNQSKFAFDDFTFGMGQAGGVAGGLGVSFEDFNTALAGTSAMFASGSDAGTSFKTFLQRLNPATEGAATAMADLGFDAYDATGKLRPLREIAEQLRVGLSGMSEEAQNQALTKAFGSDAMRTAIGLSRQGAVGLDTLAAKIKSTDAAAQSAARMQGFNAQLQALKGSFEDLAIAIGEAGILDAVTAMVTKFGAFIEKLAALDPKLLNFVLILGGVAAAVGPVLVVLGAMAQGIGAIMAVAAAPAMAGFMAALGGVAVALAPVIIAVGAAVAAFLLFRDDVEPVLRALAARAAEVFGPALRELFSAVKTAVAQVVAAFAGFGDSGAGKFLGQLSAVLIEVLGHGLISLVQGAVEVLTGIVSQIGNVVSLVAAVLRGDWSGAWKAAVSIVTTGVHTILEVIRALLPGALGAVKALVTGVSEWVGKRLGAIWDGAKQKIAAVGDAFHNLWSRVVGNSDIPDMVEGIAFWMAKLDAGMVKPAKAATGAVGDRFKALRDEVGSVMEGLLTDTERQARDLKRILDTINAGEKAGFLSPAAAEQARNRAQWTRTSTVEDQPVEMRDETLEPITDNSWDEIAENDARAAEARARLHEETNARIRDDTANFFSDLISLSNSGNKELGAIAKAAAVAQAVMNGFAAVSNALRSPAPWPLPLAFAAAAGVASAVQVAGILSTPAYAKGGHVQGPGTSTSDSILARLSHGEFVVSAKAAAANLPLLEMLNSGRIPAFAAGGLVSNDNRPRIRLTRDERGAQQGAGVQQHFDLRGAVVTEDLYRKMQEISAEHAVRSFAGARAQVPADLAQRQRRSIP